MLILKTILATLGSITVMFLLSKLLGNKQISELNMFDYINGITIGSIASEMAVSSNAEEMWVAVIAMTLYGLTGFFLSVLTMKSIRARRFIAGVPLLLIENGKLYSRNLKTGKLDTSDVLTRARNAGYFDLSQIQYAILENNGKISFMPKKADSPVTLSDLGQSPAEDKLCINVILDGVIMKENLRHTGNNDTWLYSELKKQNYSSPKEIFIATVDGNNTLTLYPKVEEKVMKNYFD